MENENAKSQEEQGAKDNDLNAQVDNENTDNDGGAAEFDASAFVSEPDVQKPAGTEDGPKGGEEGGEKDKGEGDDDDTFDWASYDETDENIGEGSESTDDNDNGNPDDSKSQDGDNNNTQGDDGTGATDVNNSGENSSLNVDVAFKAVADELGLEAGSIDELKETLEAINKENEELRSKATGGVVNDTIGKLKGFLDKSDEALVQLELKKQGFSDEEIQNAVDGYTDNNTLWIEAKKIRNTINGAIRNEEQNIAKSQQESQATQEKQRQEAVKSLTDHIASKDEMFGFKMAKDEEGLAKVREGHTKYITSGDFLADVTKDNENLTEAAWLWKNRKVILKAIGGREFNKGKQAIMDDISNPDITNKSRFKDPGGSDEFDPKAFVYGE